MPKYLVAVKQDGETLMFEFPTKAKQEKFCEFCAKRGYDYIKTVADDEVI